MILRQNSHRLFQSVISFWSWPEDTSLNANFLPLRDAFHMMVKVFHETESAKYFEVAEPWVNGLAVV